MRPVHRSRLARVGFAVPALLLVLTACGGSDTKPVAGEPAETPSAADTASSAAAEDDAASSAEEDTAAAEGAGTWDKKTLVPAMKAATEKQETAHVSMTTTSGGMRVNAEGDMALRGPRQDTALTMDGTAFGTETLEIRMVDKVLYVSMPPMTPKGKFLEIRPGDKSSPLAGMVGGMQGVDPRDTFAAFESGLRKVQFVGEESVHGEDLEHYRLTVDFGAAAKAQDLPHNAGMPRKVVYDMWLDDDALMRRLEFDMMRQVSLVMEMSDWGEPVTIEAPAPKDIVEAPAR